MSVKIIVPDVNIDAGSIISCDSQAGPYYGFPVKGAANKGSFRPVASGTPADYTCTVTATSDGVTTTTIASAMAMFGNDFFIGATLTCLTAPSHAGNVGQVVTVTDFVQSTGTFTHGAFSSHTTSGDTFTLTLSFKTRDFHFEEIASGEAGTGTFKWSHDGGTTWLGRNVPGTATWIGNKVIEAADASSPPLIIQCANGDWLCFTVSTTLKYARSTDRGLTWGTHTHITTAARIDDFLVLPSGRILIYQKHYVSYSDDDGLTWSAWTETNLPIGDAVTPVSVSLMASGQVIASCIAVADTTGTVNCFFSYDSGMTFSTAGVAIVTANAYDAAIRELDNGDLLCVYMLDEAPSTSHWGIRCKRSTDHGVTWSAEITIIAYSVAYWHPRIVQDINGDVLVVCQIDNADIAIVRFLSTDRGATWSVAATIITTGGADLSWPALNLMEGHEMACGYVSSDGNAYTIRAGMWIPYGTSADACPCAFNGIVQTLACGAQIKWMGDSGIAGDTWTLGPSYQYGATNILEDSPSRHWRTLVDSTALTTVLQEVNTIYADGIAVFGDNFRLFKFQMNATNSWGTPSVDQSIGHTVFSATTTAAGAGAVITTTDAAAYKDHELKDMMVIVVDGTSAINGQCFRITDNFGNYIVVDGDVASLENAKNIAIFQNKAALTFTGGFYEFARISINSQKTPDGYFKLGTAIIGRTTTLNRGWGIGYGKSRVYDIHAMRPVDGGPITTTGADAKTTFSLTWQANETARDEVEALLNHLQGKSCALIPDSTNLLDVYLVKFLGNMEMKQVYQNKFDFTITAEEII